MTPLPTVIRRTGFELTMIRRVGRVAIYRQHLPGGNPDHDAYEVILPQVRHPNHKGESVETYEGYPAAESWGNKGWTFTGVAKDVQKLNELEKASRAGTAGRRNRWDRKGRSGSRLKATSLWFTANNAARLVGRTNRTLPQRNGFEFHKRSQLFIVTHDETIPENRVCRDGTSLSDMNPPVPIDRNQ